MKHALLLLLVCAHTLRAEYRWTGTEWKYVEQEPDTRLNADEGSADDDYDDAYDDDDESYDDGYDVIDSSRDSVSTAGNAGGGGSLSFNQPTLGGFSDDEDFGREGSGDDVMPVDPYDDDEDRFEGSGGYDDRHSGYDDRYGGPGDRFGGTGDRYGGGTSDGFGGSSFTTPRTTTTEHSLIDLDTSYNNNEDKYSEIGPFDNNKNAGVDPVDYNNNFNYNYKGPTEPDHKPTFYGGMGEEDDDEYDDYPPYDDDNNIMIDPVPSTTTTTTTTTTAKPPPPPPRRDDNTPIITDVPTNRPVSFFAQPGILAAVIGGAVVGLLCAILLVMFIVYRMRKKDEGSYILDEPTRNHNGNLYTKTPNREFYA